jgi:dihydropteroate synthase
MGIINLTPDSFSGDGLGSDVSAAVEQALRFEAEGADFIDVGAESTRPGHESITAEEELERLMPALEAIVSRVNLPISVDTGKAVVARNAVAAGAAIINDQWGLKSEPEIAVAAAQTGAGLILMHNQKGRHYDDLIPDVASSLSASAKTALDAGVPKGNIILDPGSGFGKTPDHNLEVLNRLREFTSLGYPLMLGTSRKSTIGMVLDLPVDERVEGTAATVALAAAGGVDIVRVHDVRHMVRVCRMSDAVVRGWRPSGWER